jgi:hypothetical protein
MLLRFLELSKGERFQHPQRGQVRGEALRLEDGFSQIEVTTVAVLARAPGQPDQWFPAAVCRRGEVAVEERRTVTRRGETP